MAKNKLDIIVVVKDLASKGLDRITQSVKGVAGAVVNLSKVSLVALAVAFGKAAVDVSKFEKEFAKVKTLLDSDSFSDVGKSLSEGIKELESGAISTMGKFGLTVEDTNKALFDTISAGIPASKSIEFINEAAKLSVGGVTTLSDAVNGLTSVTNAYKSESLDATSISNAFFTAQKFGKTTVKELADNIGKVAPIAQSAGISFEELLSVTSQLTLSGLSTEAATTSLRSAISALISPSEEAKKVFEQLGIPFGKAAFEGGKLGESLGILSQKTKGNIDEIANLIPNVQALTSVTALNEEGLRSYDKILLAVKEDTTSLTNAFDEQVSTSSKQFGIFLSQIKQIGIEFLKDGSPKVVEGMKRINAALGSFAQKIPQLKIGVKKFFIDIKAIAKIFSESVKEIVSAPFNFDTYKTIFTEYLTKLRSFWAAVADISKGGLEKLKEFRRDVMQSEAEENLTLEQEILRIRKEANDQKLLLDQQYQEQLDIIREEQLIKEEDHGNRVVENAQKTAEMLKQVNQQRMKDFTTFSNFIVQGTRSESKEIAAVAKAVAIYDIGVKTYQAAMGAYNAMVGIPYVGPVLGAAAAAVALAFGASQAQAVSAQQPAFEEGGIVPGTSFTGDRVTARVNSGEMILNSGQQKRLFDIANGGESVSGGGTARDLTVVLRVGETELAEAVVNGYNTGRNLDLVTQITTE